MAYDDRGDVILGWFTRVATFLLLLGIIAFEGISLGTTRVNGPDIADQIAVAGADAYAVRHNAKTAFAAAEAAAIEHKAELVADTFAISPDGSVDLSIRQTASTLFLYRTETTARWAVVKSSGHANGQLR